MEKIETAIKTPFIKLSALLKLSGVALSGGEASLMLEEGIVLLNGEVCSMRGKKVYPGDKVMVDAEPEVEIEVVAA